MIDMRTTLPATAVAIACTLIVMVRVATAPDPVVPPHANATQMKDLAEQIAVNEQNWSVETRQNFPRDNWSQGDDFHGREYRRVTDIAKERKVRIEDILRAVDDDIHRRGATNADSPDQRHARAIPCKPRPFYD